MVYKPESLNIFSSSQTGHMLMLCYFQMPSENLILPPHNRKPKLVSNTRRIAQQLQDENFSVNAVMQKIISSSCSKPIHFAIEHLSDFFT